MTFVATIQDRAARRWTAVYLKIIAVILLLGATVHIQNILGLSGRPWLETPIHWQLSDVILLAFDIVVAIGLWRRRAWAVISLVVGLVLFQFIPYLFFTEAFATTAVQQQMLYGLLRTHTVLLTILALLFVFKK